MLCSRQGIGQAYGAKTVYCVRSRYEISEQGISMQDSTHAHPRPHRELEDSLMTAQFA